MRYHINFKGDHSKCFAVERECPYVIHADNIFEARMKYENTMNSETIQSIETKAFFKSAANVLQSIPLKELNSVQLAQTLRHEAQNLGFDVEKIDNAIDLASILHAHQTRANRGNFTNVPYIEHPLRNSLRLIRLDVTDENIIVASVLHDTIEDGAIVYMKNFHNETNVNEITARAKLSEHIKIHYGEKVLELVTAVTNDYISFTDATRLSREQKNLNYFNHVKTNISSNANVALVKLSDFIDNAAGLYFNDTPDRKTKTKNQATKYLPVVDLFLKEIFNPKLGLKTEARDNLFNQLERTKTRLQEIINK